MRTSLWRRIMPVETVDATESLSEHNYMMHRRKAGHKRKAEAQNDAAVPGAAESSIPSTSHGSGIATVKNATSIFFWLRQIDRIPPAYLYPRADIGRHLCGYLHIGTRRLEPHTGVSRSV